MMSLQVKVDQAILVPTLVQQLKPITICIEKVRNLPGVSVQSKNLLQYITPSPHTALQTYCMPAYTMFQFLPLHLKSARVARTAGILQVNCLHPSRIVLYFLKHCF